MEIPYNVKSRPDTGLYNAKLGIWLFLASEVMLFGGLFTSYVVLRVNASAENWPHGLLNIPIGTFNTFVLIASSVTVVLGWAALKMNNFARYRKFQAITILCALGFLSIKSIEYSDKFTHYEIWFKDGHRQTGHIHQDGKKAWFWNTKTLAGAPAVKDAKGNVVKPASPPIAEFEFSPDATHYSDAAKHTKGEPAAAEHKESAHASGEHAAVKVKTADIKRLSAFVPAHSTYFAIYFTLTALHGLHVLIGAVVIAYIWGPGAKLWKTNPEQYVNRIEVSGLFWHFVDLVWIFLFPILYLL
ncbi:MAG: heme-copper oxidase subunit III [Verrucomicrobia bacterium]|nr:heme-copper oxidase subunit III [Verrucomicrobiota bacterium]